MIFLTAHHHLTDRLSGFSAGGDDYLAKPFHLAELAARPRAALKRSGPPPTTAAGDVILDPARFTCTVADSPVDLTPTEFRLLAACGDRRLAARAIGRAALASASPRSGVQVPTAAARATTGPVPARVKALLAQAPVRRVAPALLAMGLLCTAAGASSLGGAVWLHRGVEPAQGEHSSD